MTTQLVRFEPRELHRVPRLPIIAGRGGLRPHAALALKERRPERERLPFAVPRRVNRSRLGAIREWIRATWHEPIPTWLAWLFVGAAVVAVGYAAGRAF